MDGIAIGHNNADESSKNAAHLLLKLLTERNIPAEVIHDPLGFRVRGVPTNAIIVAVCQRPNKTKANLVFTKAKIVDLHDQRDRLVEQQLSIARRSSELSSKRFVVGSKELAEAQEEVNSLNAQSSKIRNDENSISLQERKLYDKLSLLYEQVARESETNSASFSGSGTFMDGKLQISDSSNIVIRGTRPLVPLE